VAAELRRRSPPAETWPAAATVFSSEKTPIPGVCRRRGEDKATVGAGILLAGSLSLERSLHCCFFPMTETMKEKR
jgi:hypothetical protein